ncbi:hypothetical protein Tco_1054749 [Tanacetum coccineum]|uniref:Retrovirus-related Pol polyprotein from transposon TNT 1-94-like beta-barrel domain-containing protein n=1 Tax=Tanacetum coccineum TaxID=301880 RepID=A0ABQ5GZR1_9ASTR
MLDSQSVPNVKIGLDMENEKRLYVIRGFHAVPPPLSGNFMPPKADLSFVGLDDSVYTSTAVTKDAPKSNEVFVKTPKEVKSSAPLIQDWDTDSDNESIFRPKHVFEKVNFVKEGEYESCPFVPRAVLLRSGKIPVSTAKPKQAVSTSVPRQVNTVRPKQSVNFPKNTFNRSHSPITRSHYAPSAQRRSLSPKRVSTVRQAVNTGKGNGITAVKPSAGCIWRPRPTETNQVSKDNKWICTMEHPQIALKDKGIADSGCSRHMTGTKEYLSDYQEIKGGFVAFGEGKGRITGKGNIKTDKLDFDDVYYVNGLKFNLFSVSQMCDKKNSVLFTETKCLVLSLNFKLLDESQVVKHGFEVGWKL